MKAKSGQSATFSGNAQGKSTEELSVYDAPPAVLEARHRIKELLKNLDKPETVRGLAEEILQYLNTAVRAMAKDDLALVLPQSEQGESEAA